MHEKEFIFSRDILSAAYNNPFAVYVFNNGFGVVKPGKLVVFDNVGNSVIRGRGDAFGNRTLNRVRPTCNSSIGILIPDDPAFSIG